MMDVLRNRRSQLWVLVLACVVFILIIRPWELYFLNDDFLHIPMPNKWLFLRGGFMRPVPNYVLLWDKWLYGTNATGFFTTAIFFHLATVFAVYFLTKKCIEKYLPAYADLPVPFFTALLFLFYPFHGESVMWVIARVSIIAALFTLMSLLFYIKSAHSKFYLLLSWICFVIALFAYESIWNVIIIFAVISLADTFFKLDSRRSSILRFLVMAISFGAYLLLRIKFLNSVAGDGYLEINENIHNVKLLVVNLVKLVGRNYTPPFEKTVYSLVFFVISTLFYLYLVRSTFLVRKELGWFMLLLCAFLVSGVVTASPLGIDTHFNESDRYLYYSSYFYCFFIAIAGCTLLSMRISKAILFAVSFLFAWMLYVIQGSYAFASSVTRTTVFAVKQGGDFKNGYFIDVPQKYKGALIFRISLRDGIKWIAPEVKFDSIIIASQQNFSEKNYPYKLGEIKWSELAASKGWDIANEIIPTGNRMMKIEKDDRVYWFRKDGLYKVNLP
jgi:hypothetical protein